MHVNLYGQVTRTEKEVIDLLYQNPDLNLNFINFDNSIIVEKFNLSAKSCDLNIKLTKNVCLILV
jgi:hypothetical protein